MRNAARLWLPLVAIALAIPACSNGDEEAQDLNITFEITSYPMTLEAELVATGAAVDEGLMCAEATQTGHRFEYPDGTEMSMSELEQLNAIPEPFSYTAIGQWACDDGSGSFTFRTLNDIENPVTFTSTFTWDLEGGDGYEDVTGEGPNDDFSMSEEGDVVVFTGTNSGVLRKG